MAANAASSSSSSPSGATDAIALLTADHEEVRQLFKEYDRLVANEADDEQRQELAELICVLLTVHAQLEEEIFYPAVRQALDDDDRLLVDEAAVEHTCAEDLIAQIEDSSPDEELFDARVRVLGEYVEHHVREEEDAMFPKLRKANLDVDELGERIAARRDELLPDVEDDDDT